MESGFDYLRMGCDEVWEAREIEFRDPRAGPCNHGQDSRSVPVAFTAEDPDPQGVEPDFDPLQG